MNKNIKTYLILLILIASLFSCDGFHQEIVSVDVNVENVDRVLVINGKIEQDEHAIIQISYSEDIDASITTPIHYEENATVILSSEDGSQEELDYTGDGWHYGTDIKGEVNETYTITIEIGTQTYTATSTMFPPPGYRDAWVVQNEEKGSSVSYSDEWRVLDPPETRNRYLFEWWRNGNHIVRRDWAIDDNRVVNAGGSLRLFTVTMDPGPNEHTRHRAAEIDKITYDYYNMYEKIVRGLVSVDSQTPYNPASNFGEGTIGNFRAVAFSSAVVLTPPNITATGQNEQVIISYALNQFFTTYNLYWSTSPDITKESNVISDLGNNNGKENGGGKDNGKGEDTTGEFANYIHKNLTNGTTYYYRIEVEDAEGNVSILSPEVSTAPDPNVPADEDPDIKPAGNAPQNVTAVPGDNPGEIVISWDPANGAKQQYGIYWSNEPGIRGDSNENAIWAGKGSGVDEVSSPFTHTGLDNTLTYYYRVAVWDGASLHLSEEVSATPN